MNSAVMAAIRMAVFIRLNMQSLLGELRPEPRSEISLNGTPSRSSHLTAGSAHSSRFPHAFSQK